MKNGYKEIVKKKSVTPYLYHDGRLTVTAHYRAYIACYEDGRRLWTQSSGVDRISRGAAQKDAFQMVHDSILLNNK